MHCEGSRVKKRRGFCHVSSQIIKGERENQVDEQLCDKCVVDRREKKGPDEDFRLVLSVLGVHIPCVRDDLSIVEDYFVDFVRIRIVRLVLEEVEYRN